MRADCPPKGPKTVTLTGRLLVNHSWLIGMLVSIRAGKGKTLVVIYVCLSVKQVDGARRERFHICMWTKPKYSESKRCGWTDVFNYEAVYDHRSVIWSLTPRPNFNMNAHLSILGLICHNRRISDTYLCPQKQMCLMFVMFSPHGHRRPLTETPATANESEWTMQEACYSYSSQTWLPTELTGKYN